MAQEFHISVTPLGAQDEYLVRTEQVAPGVPLAEEQVKWSVEDWLATARQLMNDPLLGLLQGGAANANQSSLTLVALGQHLYNALFQDSLRDSWMMAQAIAENQRSVLRLRLGLKGTRLPRLPWEVLYAGDRPLATGTDVAFSRYQLIETRTIPSLRSYSQAATIEPDQPLKILMVIAGPSDRETLRLKQEANQLQEELRSRSRNGSPTIQLTLLEQPGREQMTQALEQGQYHIFHYGGHSNLGVNGGDLYLVNGKTGLTEAVNGDDLAGLLVNNGIQLAVFNSCRGAYVAASNAVQEGNLTQALVKRGIPSVLAMAERIPDEVALTLTRLFYRNLNQGYPIDLSLNRARQGLVSAYGSNQLYWALPVLYLDRQCDGFLTGSHDAKEIAARLALPDPFENFFGSEQEETQFTTKAISADFLDADDELVHSTSHESENLPDLYDEMDADDLGYEEDLALVSDLFRQIAQGNSPTTEPMPPVSGSEHLFPEASKGSAVSVNQDLAQKPLNGRAAVITPATSEKQLSEARKSNSIFFLTRWWQSMRRAPLFLPVLGTTGAIAIAIAGFWFFQNRSLRPSELLSGQPILAPALTNSNPQQINFNTGSSVKLATYAIGNFNQGELDNGERAVEELLNRNNVAYAKEALAAVPKQQLDRAAISFLRGRLAWQSIATGSKVFSVDDARRFWETAVKQEPENILYRNALGFAYYQEGNFEGAIEVWFKTLSISGQKQATPVSSVPNKNVLNTYAGLALAMKQAAQKLPATDEKREKMLNKAKQMSQKVITDAPTDFQPEALSKNWMWQEKTIQDWQALVSTNRS